MDSPGVIVNIYVLITTLAMVGLLAVVARRVMAAPVGWVRAGLVSLFAMWVGGGIIEAIFDRSPGLAALFDGPGAATPDIALLCAIFLLVFVGVFVAGLAVLLILEVLIPTRTIPSPWRMIRGLRRRWRQTRRYLKILAVFTRRGIAQGLRRGLSLRRPSPVEERELAEALRDALSAAGVTFVKFGQMLSTRRDLLPDSLADALASLQSDVPPAPWSQVRIAIEQVLDGPIEETFERFDADPLASASVGQVHTARLLGGREVVVKVQRPGARNEVEADLELLSRLARRAGREAWGADLGIVDLADGFAASLREELDYDIELENTAALRAALAANPGKGSEVVVRIPEVYPQFSGPTLLVMERLDGIAVGAARLELAALPAQRRHDMAVRLLDVALEQLLVFGTFHADLHPGNILITPEGDLGLLDFGSVGRLADTERTSFGALLLAVDADDSVAAARALVGLLDAPADLDSRALERSVGQLVARFRAATAGGGVSTSMFTAMFRLVTESRLAVPGQIAGAFRTLASLEGTLRHLDPGFDIVTEARSAAWPLVSRLASPDVVARRAAAQFAALVPELERLPGRLADLSSDLAAGRLTVTVRTFADPASRSFVASLARQVVVAALAAACLLAGILLLMADSGPVLSAGISLYSLGGAALTILGTVLGVRVLVFALRPGRLGGD